MKTLRNTLNFFVATLSIAVLFSNCEKEASLSPNRKQQGNTIIDVIEIFTQGTHYIKGENGSLANYLTNQLCFCWFPSLTNTEVSAEFFLSSGKNKNENLPYLFVYWFCKSFQNLKGIF